MKNLADSCYLPMELEAARESTEEFFNRLSAISGRHDLNHFLTDHLTKKELDALLEVLSYFQSLRKVFYDLSSAEKFYFYQNLIRPYIGFSVLQLADVDIEGLKWKASIY